MNWEECTEQDLETLTAQIKRLPRGVIGLVMRCPSGCPRVVVTSPVIRDAAAAEIFPTLFWITCPALTEFLARLESDGWLERLQYLLDRNNDLESGLLAAHQEYAFLRRQSLPSTEYDRLRQDRQDGLYVIENTGVGGARNLKRIKCLHAHYAHWLATRNNPIGQLVELIVQESETARCQACRSRVAAGASCPDQAS